MTYVPKNEDGSTMDIHITSDWQDDGEGTNFPDWKLARFRRALEPWNFDPFDEVKAAQSFRAARYLLEEVDRLEAENQRLRSENQGLQFWFDNRTNALEQAWDEGFQSCADRSYAVHVDLTDAVADYTVVFGEAPTNPYRGRES